MIFSIRLTLDFYILKTTTAKLKSNTKEVIVRFLNKPIVQHFYHIKFLAFVCKVITARYTEFSRNSVQLQNIHGKQKKVSRKS